MRTAFVTLGPVSQIIRAGSSGPSEPYARIEAHSLTAALGPFRDNPEGRLLGYIHPPEHLKSTSNQYVVVRVEGHSMEPRIPSGSYCLIRMHVAGSRSGRTVLVEERKIAECAYTMKRYLRIRSLRGEPDRIILRSDNPDQPDIEINEDGESQDQRYAVIGEFREVLQGPLDWLERYSPSEAD